jgi:hypothetical protein
VGFSLDFFITVPFGFSLSVFGFKDFHGLKLVDAQNFLHRWAAYQSAIRVNTGRDLCVWGMLSPKLDSKCGRSLRG